MLRGYARLCIKLAHAGARAAPRGRYPYHSNTFISLEKRPIPNRKAIRLSGAADMRPFRPLNSSIWSVSCHVPASSIFFFLPCTWDRRIPATLLNWWKLESLRAGLRCGRRPRNALLISSAFKLLDVPCASQFVAFRGGAVRGWRCNRVNSGLAVKLSVTNRIVMLGWFRDSRSRCVWLTGVKRLDSVAATRGWCANYSRPPRWGACTSETYEGGERWWGKKEGGRRLCATDDNRRLSAIRFFVFDRTPSFPFFASASSNKFNWLSASADKYFYADSVRWNKLERSGLILTFIPCFFFH